MCMNHNDFGFCEFKQFMETQAKIWKKSQPFGKSILRNRKNGFMNQWSDENICLLCKECTLVLMSQVFSQRLEDEYDAQVLITTPSVPYRLKLTPNSPTAKLNGSADFEVTNPSHWPAPNEIVQFFEPMIKGELRPYIVYGYSSNTIPNEAFLLQGLSSVLRNI